MPMPRLSPSFVVAVVALVIAAAGAGYAAGKVTSQQIKDGTIQSRDVHDGALTGADVRNGSLGRAELDRGCAKEAVEVFGGCVPPRAFGPSSYPAAIDGCNRRGGRLPSTAELKWIATHDEFEWANGNAESYEFTGDSSDGPVFSPIALKQDGEGISNASAQQFWYHCVIS